MEHFDQGVTSVAELARLANTTTSYVAAVLSESRDDGGDRLLPAYFDLYTSTSRSMNVYADRFRGRMRFRDVDSAERSVEVLEQAWRDFDEQGDRAGQHHAMVLAMIMANRARFGAKPDESRVFSEWLVSKLELPHPTPEEVTQRAANTDVERHTPGGAEVAR